MIHVAIDGLLVSDPDSAGRGLGRYVHSLITSLAELQVVELTALMQGPRQLPASVARVDVARRRRPPRLEWYEHVTRIGIDARRVGADVLHSPGLHPPLGYRRPWVQTLHDIIPLVYPSPVWGREVFRWRVRARLIRSATAVICGSRHTADLAVRRLGLRSDRLHVIHYGVMPIFRQPRPEGPAPESPYVLYVGGYGPHKGYEDAFEVAARIADAGLPHGLRLVGGVHPAHHLDVATMHRSSRRPDRVELLGQVTDDDLLTLYHGASALIVTSRYEGFGLPTVEALAAGAPVVSYDNSSLAEVLGDGGILVRDGDLDRFAAEVVDLLRDDSAQADLRARGYRRSQQFDWDVCAKEHAEVYESVV